MKNYTHRIISENNPETTQYDAREKKEEAMIHKACSQHYYDGNTPQEHSSLHRFRNLITQRNQQETRLCSADPQQGESSTEAKRRSLISRWFYSSLHYHHSLKSEVSLT